MNNNYVNSPYKKGFYAALASMTSMLSYPLEVIKVRYQVLEQHVRFRGVFIKMLQQEGFRSFFKGFNQNVIIGLLGYGSVFGFFDIFYNKHKHYLSHNPNCILSSIISATIAVTLISPFNYIKTRQILCTGDINNHSIYKITQQIYLETNSLLGFWKAINP